MNSKPSAFVTGATGFAGGHLCRPAPPVLLAARAAEMLWTALPGEPPLHRRRVGFFVVSRAHSIAKARRVLGYEPQVELAAGLRSLADWYRANGFL